MMSPLSDSGFLGQRVDFVFYAVLLVSIIAFLMGEIFFFVRKMRGKGSKGIEKKHFETGWSVIPLMVLLLLTAVETHFLSPIKLKAMEQHQNTSSNYAPEIPSKTQNIKEDRPKSFKIKKLKSAVRM
jgi:heme/copper-type cytochrome/quinol oxidase subunit 2